VEIDKPRCGICQFHEPTPIGNGGKCRRYPPSNNGSINTGLYDWCGEYSLDSDKLKDLQLIKKQEKPK
jgi:hypothetical protein